MKSLKLSLLGTFLLCFVPLVLAQESGTSERLLNCDVSRDLQVQILLDVAGFSPGEIDGKIGSNTRRALNAFQESQGLNVTGTPGPDTLEALNKPEFEPVVLYTITTEDAGGPFTEEIPEDMLEKAELKALNYTSTLELLSEKFHIQPELLQNINPNSSFNSGDEICVPNVVMDLQDQAETRDVSVIVSEKNSDLIVQTLDGEILFYAPVTAGSERDPLPTGSWKVTGVVKNPNFYYNPDLFWDADSTHSKATIRPGPNNPVGVIWINLNAEHYGLHGTPDPEKIGHSESYGCVRLTNWDVTRLARFVKPGTQVIFNDAKKMATR